MPALVVWERLIVAGDDLRLNAVFVSIIRLLQILLVIFILYSIIQFDHQPELFVMTGCLSHEDNYWMWYNFCLAGCVIILIYSLVGAVIEATIFKVSGRVRIVKQEVGLFSSSSSTHLTFDFVREHRHSRRNGEF